MRRIVAHVRTLPSPKTLVIAAAVLVVLLPQMAFARSTADLKLGLSGSPDPVPMGGIITWTITVANLGPGEATGVRLQAHYGSDTSAISATTTQGTCEHTVGGEIDYSLGTIPAGATVTTTAVMKTWGGDGEGLGARVTSTSRDPVTSNNEISREVEIIPGEAPIETPAGLFCPPTGGVATGGGGTAPGFPVWFPAVGLIVVAALLAGGIRLARR